MATGSNGTAVVSGSTDALQAYRNWRAQQAQTHERNKAAWACRECGWKSPSSQHFCGGCGQARAGEGGWASKPPWRQRQLREYWPRAPSSHVLWTERKRWQRGSWSRGEEGGYAQPSFDDWYADQVLSGGAADAAARTYAEVASSAPRGASGGGGKPAKQKSGARKAQREVRFADASVRPPTAGLATAGAGPGRTATVDFSDFAAASSQPPAAATQAPPPPVPEASPQHTDMYPCIQMLQQTIQAASATFPELASALGKALEGLQVPGAPPPPPQEPAVEPEQAAPQVVAARLRNKIAKADQRIQKSKDYIAAVDAELAEIEEQAKALRTAREERAQRVQQVAKERRTYRRQYEQVMAQIEALEVVSSDPGDDDDEDMSVAGVPIVRMAANEATQVVGSNEGVGEASGDEEEVPAMSATEEATGRAVPTTPCVVPPPQVVLPPNFAASLALHGAAAGQDPLEAARAKRARSASVARRQQVREGFDDSEG